MRKKLLASPILLLFVLSLLSVNMIGVSAVDSPCIKVVPESTVTKDLTVGMLYTVSIYTDYVGTDKYYDWIVSYQVELGYDPNILEGFEVTNGDLIVGESARFIAGPFDNEAGKLELTVGYFDNTIHVKSGPGTLVDVTFRIVGAGTSAITIGNLTKLFAWDDWEMKEYIIIDAAKNATHIQHGTFDNSEAPAYPPFPPVARITSDPDVYVNDLLTFSGASSYDPDGLSIISYKWDFGDGTTGTGETVYHAYTIVGIYTVTLRVTDEQNQLSDLAEFSMTVKERSPYVADLVKWKAKPEAHTWDYSKDFLTDDGLVDLAALARNKGSQPVNVSITFAIIDAASGTPAGDLLVANAELAYGPELDVPISVKLDPYAYGWHPVTNPKVVLFAHVTLTYDSTGDGTPDTDASTKIVRFAVVP